VNDNFGLGENIGENNAVILFSRCASLRGFVILSTLALCACAASPSNSTSASVSRTASDYIASDAVRKTLYQQWRGTKYHFGGMSKAGVDCSGFVFLTYRDRLGVELPRTTLHQPKTGSLVEPSELLAGDLVFFLTDGKTRHVDIYLNADQFVHASKSKGLVVSSLSNNYWCETFWQARRINR
jgi:cell wall-associated NlpC family hydrolase